MHIKDSPAGIGAIGDDSFHGDVARFHGIPLAKNFRGGRVDMKILLDQLASCIKIVDQFEYAACYRSQMVKNAIRRIIHTTLQE
jgi:hypothetical protein